MLPSTKKSHFNIDLPSKKTVKISPFSGHTEKAFLTVKASKDNSMIMQTVIDALSECVEGGVNVGDLIQVDFEYLFLKMFEISVANEISVGLKCSNCPEVMKANIPISAIKPPKVDKTSFTIAVGKDADTNKDVNVVFDYPSINAILNAENSGDERDTELMWGSLKGVYIEDKLLETTKEEFIPWMLDQNKLYSKILKQLAEIPKLSFRRKWKCEKCGTENETVLEGLNSFFTLSQPIQI